MQNCKEYKYICSDNIVIYTKFKKLNYVQNQNITQKQKLYLNNIIFQHTKFKNLVQNNSQKCQRCHAFGHEQQNCPLNTT